MCAGMPSVRIRLMVAAVCVCSAVFAGFPGWPAPDDMLPSAQDLQAVPAERGGRAGYLLVLELLDGKARFDSAAEIENYLENRQLISEDDWLLLLLSDSGQQLGARRIGNPARFYPDPGPGQPIPFVAKIPSITGLATVVLYDHTLSEQLRIPIDGSFRARADFRRREFLAHDRENRRLITEGERQRSGRMNAALLPARKPEGMASLTEEIQRKIRGEVVQEIERMGQIGVEASTGAAHQAEAGWILAGTVLGEGGVTVNGAYVLLRQLAFTTTFGSNWYVRTGSNGKFSFSIPRNLAPTDFVIAAYAQDYALQCYGLAITGDTTSDIQLTRAHTVSGTVRDNLEKPLRGVRVRAYQDGNLTASALTDTDGTYDFDLPAGAYEMEALPAAGSTLAPAVARNIVIGEPRTLDFTLIASAGILSVKLNFPRQEVYSRFSSRSLVRFELFQAGAAVFAGNGVSGPAGSDPATGRFYRTYNLYLREGSYTLSAFVAGCRPIHVSGLEISGESSVTLDLPEPYLWTGVLRGADHTPLAHMTIQSYTDLAREYELTTTNASGEFSILLTPNGFVKFHTDAGSNNILRTVRIGDVTAGRDEDVILDSFPAFEDSGGPLTQIYGVPDRLSRWNIVMIGDGYTNITETYSDLNQNGRWDGVIYYDLNKNGAFDSGERYQRYGSAAAPAAGSNPNLTNEPFTDLNGDGVPNLRDQELFDQNTLDTARSLFGQDEWQLHRDIFNIFRIRLVSRQAGHDIRDQDNKVVIDRDTALGTYLSNPDRNYLFSANYTLITQYINQYVPECDTRIVMVNQPVRMGRVNSYMFQYGGDISTLCNDYVVAHEMGHNVGRLADEYTEYQEFYRGSESAARNITALVDPRHIPWRHLITPGKEIPSFAGSRGVGLYEGAGYYTGGRYRPTEYCMMVSGNRYCPVCTAEIEMRIGEITGAIPDALPLFPSTSVSGLHPEFKWEPLPGASHFLLEIEKADGSQLVASYDVYATVFDLPFALTENAEYRWRLRPASAGSWGNWSSWVHFSPSPQSDVFTGVFAQIAAGDGYETVLTAINTGQSAADLLVSLLKSDGAPFDLPAGPSPIPVHFNLRSMGSVDVKVSRPGSVQTGTAHLAATGQIAGAALLRSIQNSRVLSEAGFRLTRTAKNVTLWIDNTGYSRTGYAIANTASVPATFHMTLRDMNGSVKERAVIAMTPGQNVSEFACQRFPLTGGAGFEGSIEFSGDQELAALALRYDNVDLDGRPQVFSSIPPFMGDASTHIVFPQVVDGAGYRSELIFANPSDTPASAKVEFFRSDGTPLGVPIRGQQQAGLELPLSPKGAAHLATDGGSGEIVSGWIRVTSPVPVFGAVIFQSVAGPGVLAEAGVGASPPALHFAAHVESLGSTGSGIAICNPGASAVSVLLHLRRPDGQVVASTNVSLSAMGQIARYFTEWFPRGYGEFAGTLEFQSTGPVHASGLRYDNADHSVFAALPLTILP